MSKPISSSAPVSLAYVTLRILIVVNWLMVPVILVLLFIVPNRQWIMSSFDLSPSPDADRLVMGLRAIAVLGLATIPLNYVVLKKLLAIVETVRGSDPFVAANADRLQAIAWVLLALKFSVSPSAPSVMPFPVRRIRSISMPAFQSTAGSPCSSRSCWLACSRKARSCAKSCEGRCDMAIAARG